MNGALPLTQWGVIRAEGEDAAKFLHSQLTNDFALLGLGEARLAAYCSVKGRILASLIGWKVSHTEILLACSADVLAPTLKRLTMFVLRSKAKLSDASATVRLVGLAGEAAGRWIGAQAPAKVWDKSDVDSAAVIRLPDAAGMARYLWAVPHAPASTPESTPDSTRDPLRDLPPLPAASWQWLEVQSGVATITAPVVEQFVPQMVNYEMVGGVNFQKGCYPGQEIVARSHYLGKLKRRAFLAHSPAELTAGQEVFHSADPGQPSGMVVQAAPAPDGGWDALIELKLSVIDGGTLHAGAPGGSTLELRTLPYALPSEA